MSTSPQVPQPTPVLVVGGSHSTDPVNTGVKLQLQPTITLKPDNSKLSVGSPENNQVAPPVLNNLNQVKVGSWADALEDVVSNAIEKNDGKLDQDMLSTNNTSTYSDDPSPDDASLDDESEVTEDQRKKLLVDKDYPVFVINSFLSPSMIKEKIESYIPAEVKQRPGYNSDDYVGPLRIIRARGEQTNRTLCVMDRTIYLEMIKHGLDKTPIYSDFRVREYNLKRRHLPSTREQRYLYLPLPPQLTIPVVIKQLTDFLNLMLKFKVVSGTANAKPYEIMVPFVDRKASTHTSKGHIIWDSDVKIADIAMVRTLLHDTDWLDEAGNVLGDWFNLRRCDWDRYTDASKIPMSPADRVQTYNTDSLKRQSKIRRRDKIRRQGNNQLKDKPKEHDNLKDKTRSKDYKEKSNNKNGQNYRDKNKPGKRYVKSSKKVNPTVELPPVVTPSTLPTAVAYKPLSLVQQPNSVREGQSGTPVMPTSLPSTVPYQYPVFHYPTGQPVPVYHYPYTAVNDAQKPNQSQQWPDQSTKEAIRQAPPMITTISSSTLPSN